MDNTNKALFASFALLISVLAIWALKPIESKEENETEDLFAPYEFFDFERSYPYAKPDVVAMRKVMEDIAATAIGPVKAGNPFNEQWQVEGPGNIGGRINCIAVHPQNSDIIFTGTPTGGIYKTTNGGNSWTPVFDDQVQLSIACIVFDPTDANIMYAGTGDPNISGFAFMGNGIYKSTDGGNSWNYLGLSAQSIISKIAVDPTNPQVIYAASMGVPHTQGPNRGLYKTTDGGQTWEQILSLGNDAGIIDLIMDPSNPQTLYASGWNRIRNNQQTIGFGNASKIFKTTDGGQNWTVLSNGLPAPGLSRINLDIIPSSPQTLYASFVDSTYNLYGLYKTTNGGSSWAPIGTNGLSPNATGGFGWYFSHLKVNPFNSNKLYFLGVDLWETTNGGGSWDYGAPEWWNYDVHADKHDMVFLDANTYLLATDGGLYRTDNGGLSWDDIDIIPNTQFYRVAYNPFNPDYYYGGAQDNGTTGGNLAIYSSWPRLFGGDGFTAVFDPTDPNIIYHEVQFGVIYWSDDGGNNWQNLDAGLDPDDRYNWDMQYFLSKTEPQTMYTGTQRMYRMVGAPYGVWQPISPDLTDGVIFGPRFHTISTVSQSPLKADYLYAGTTDGNVWRTLDGGNNWDNITSTLPDRYVTGVYGSPNDTNTVFVTHSGYLYNDYLPHIHKSINKGDTWIDITGDLPQVAVNDLLVIEGKDSLLFAATDAGVYGTINGGTNWFRVGNNMPTIIIEDVEYNPSTGMLVAGTHGRSIMTYPLQKILEVAVPELAFNLELSTYPNPAADMLVVKLPHSISKNASVKLFTMEGKQVTVNSQLQGYSMQIDVANLPKGMYFVLVTDGKREGVTKFVKS